MDPTKEEERLIEYITNYLLALGALQGIQAENIATWVRPQSLILLPPRA